MCLAFLQPPTSWHRPRHNSSHAATTQSRTRATSLSRTASGSRVSADDDDDDDDDDGAAPALFSPMRRASTSAAPPTSRSPCSTTAASTAACTASSTTACVPIAMVGSVARWVLGVVVVMLEGGGGDAAGGGSLVVGGFVGFVVDEDDKDDDLDDEEEEEDKEEDEDEDVEDEMPPRVRTPSATVRYQPASFSSAVATRRCSCGCEEQTLHSSVAEMARVASRLEVSTASMVRGPGGGGGGWWLLVPPLLLPVVEADLDPDNDGDDEDDGNDERHMLAHVCKALMALAAAVRQGFVGLEQRRVGVLTRLLALVPAFLLIGKPPSFEIASGSDGGVVAVMALVPKLATSQDSQASMSDREPREEGAESASRSGSSDAAGPTMNSDSSLPLGDVPTVPDGSRLKKARPWLLVPRVWASSGYKLHSIVGHNARRCKTLTRDREGLAGLNRSSAERRLIASRPARRVGRPQGRGSRQPKARRDSATRGADFEVRGVSLEQSADPGTPASPNTRRSSGAVDPGDSAPLPSPLDTPPSLGSLTPMRSRQQPAHSSESVAAGSSYRSLAPSARSECESDCIELAMTTQRELESATNRLSSTYAPTGPWAADTVQAAEAAMQTAGAAMRRMSTTLICPCSEKLETGVIVSAACLSILDLYGAIVSRFTTRPMCTASQHSPLMAIMSNTSGVDGGGSGLELLWGDVLPSFSAPGDALRCGQKEDHMLLHVLGELAKLATVVCQFTNRYRPGVGQAQPGSSEMEILQGLAALLKYRLKGAGEDTAAKLQTAPPHRGTHTGGTA
ncbi:hypothetical protein B0I37DRAFT_353558 [Chaetomium sp. MPI-CAGE-AT-0009]|nr:hypothetical protein B0I37DRAFT_353558 [Chaetomium sp. MPI-CAGE-AT-0009]